VRRQTSLTPAPAAATAGIDQQQMIEEFAGMTPEEMDIEFLTVPGFIRRVPYRWHLDDITRFGDKVGRVAEALQVAYITRIDRHLGVIRVFPEALLRRVYEILAGQYGWPRIIEALPEGSADETAPIREELRAAEKAEKALEPICERVDDVCVIEALRVVRTYLEQHGAELRGKLSETAPA
jgi:hypothetical protein